MQVSIDIVQRAGKRPLLAQDREMQALNLHKEKKPSLSKGTMFLPLQSWGTVTGPLRVLRAVERRQRSGGGNYLTLVQIPEAHPVAVILGDPEFSLRELDFAPLNGLAREDESELKEWLSRDCPTPDLSSGSIVWLVRLVIGESLPKSALKWTKDLRVLEQGKRKASTKRY